MEVERQRKLRESRPDYDAKAQLEADAAADRAAQQQRQQRVRSHQEHVRRVRDQQLAERKAAEERRRQERAEHERHALESARRADLVSVCGAVSGCVCPPHVPPSPPQFLRQQERRRKDDEYKFLHTAMVEAQKHKEQVALQERRQREQDAQVEQGHVDAVVHEYAVRDAMRRRRVDQLSKTVVRVLAWYGACPSSKTPCSCNTVRGVWWNRISAFLAPATSTPTRKRRMR